MPRSFALHVLAASRYATDIFHGEVINLRDVISFQGQTVKALRKAFRDSFNDYLDIRVFGSGPNRKTGGLMKLIEQDTKLYFQLMWALQFYVNQKLKIQDIKSIDDYADSAIDQKVEVREALYENIELIDSFVRENPQNFSTANLAIISEWKKFIKGSFFIERLLKKYTVFIQEDKVYAVLGLSQSFDQLTYNAKPPLYVDTVLLPFKGKIVYDGLLGFQNIYFGGGIRRSLKETYMRAKQNNRIIDSLEKPQVKNHQKSESKSLKDWKPVLEELALKAKKLKGSVESPAIYSPAFSLVKASIEFAQLAVSDADDQVVLYKALQKVRRAFNKSSTVLNREEY